MCVCTRPSSAHRRRSSPVVLRSDLGHRAVAGRGRAWSLAVVISLAALAPPPPPTPLLCAAVAPVPEICLRRLLLTAAVRCSVEGWTGKKETSAWSWSRTRDVVRCFSALRNGAGSGPTGFDGGTWEWDGSDGTTHSPTHTKKKDSPYTYSGIPNSSTRCIPVVFRSSGFSSHSFLFPSLLFFPSRSYILHSFVPDTTQLTTLRAVPTHEANK